MSLGYVAQMRLRDPAVTPSHLVIQAWPGCLLRGIIGIWHADKKGKLGESLTSETTAWAGKYEYC